MNRREFCQTTALLLAGAVCTRVECASGTPHSEGRSIPFRVQKVFLESWDAENVWLNSPRTILFIRKKLESIRRNGCSCLLLVLGCHGIARWTQRIVPEADHFGMKVFVPASLNRECFWKARTAVPLSHKAGILQAEGGRPAESDGLLLLDETNDLLGLLLYDLSRCRWTGFAPYGVGTVQNSEDSTNDSRLVAAQWIDHVFSSQKPLT